MSYPGQIIFILGVSGAGKNTIITELLKKDLGLTQVISCKTRPLRPDEIQDVAYHYMTPEEFQHAIINGEFLEYAQVHGMYYYGTRKSDIIEKLNEGAHIIKELDIQGIQIIAENHPDVWEVTTSIFLDIDNDTMRHRIQNRASLVGASVDEDELTNRIHSAEMERELAKKYCTVIVDGKGTIAEEAERVAGIVQEYLHHDDTIDHVSEIV